jgi:death-on-curing protein
LVTYLDYDTVVAINMEHAGPSAGVRDESGLRSAVGEPAQTFDRRDLYPNVWAKAAVLVRGIAATQCFHDGNKRTAWLAGQTFLGMNRIEIRTLPVEFKEVYIRAAAAGAIDLDLSAGWLKAAATWGSRVGAWLDGNR